MRFLLALMQAAQPDAVCAPCHRAETQKYAGNAMSRALYRAEDAAPLRASKLSYKLGKFNYSIERHGNQPVYTVADGQAILAVPLRYAFGQGAAGQTYVYQYDGRWYESRVSYYAETRALDLTMGAPPGEPKSLLEAAGREMTQKDVVECFGCHTTGSVRRDPGQSPRIDFERIQPGVGCANCHVGAERHARAVQAGKAAEAGLPKLSRLSTEEQSDFCGRCHRTWADIAANGPRGVGNVRFQPYRIANSKCYDAADRRISCTACHDTHGPLEKKLSAYDSKCIACHAPRAQSKSCPKSKSDCASCHMPRYEIPGSHHLFTDHYIRIVRNHEVYPN